MRMTNIPTTISFKIIFLILSITLILVSCKEKIIESPLDDSGSLLIDSEPKGAIIFLQGTNTGKVTPDSIQNLQPDNYQLMLRFNGVDTTFYADVKARLKTSIFVNLNPFFGSVFISSNPTNVLIAVDGISTGKFTPDTIKNLKVGTHLITLYYLNDSVSTLVNINSNNIATSYISFFGSLFINSNPSGAQIWVNGSNTGKVTPDTLSNLSTTQHSLTLKLAEYRDTTFIVNVIGNQLVSRNITLRSELTLTKYASVRLWETTGTGASQPSGLDLSLGMAYGISSSNNGLIDIYYSSNGYLIQSAHLGSGMTRVTKFRVGNANNIDDGIDSPLQTSGTWVNNVTDTQANYFYLYDNDGHYSKALISARGGGSAGLPAWVEITWWYNSIVDDVRF